MTVVAIVHHSGFGHTAKVAERIASGASTVPGVTVKSFPITDAQINGGRWQDEAVLNELQTADAIVFGAPTYMGMVSGQFKCFADATAPIWFNRAWKDKIAAGFTSSGYASGDKVMTLHYLATLAAQLRMLWIGPAEMPSNITQDGRDLDRNGYYIGVGVVGNLQDPGSPNEGDLETARLYGARIAMAALRWREAA
jgi:NAD(P)H dehydrogenase (quinone)